MILQTCFMVSVLHWRRVTGIELGSTTGSVIREEVVFMKRGNRLAEVKHAGFPTPTRYCLHVENGDTGIPKMCILNHECYHCAFDQWMDSMEDGEISQFAEAA